MNKVQTDLFGLLRLALWGRKTDAGEMSSVDWDAVYKLAMEQCVIGLVADSFGLLRESELKGLDKLRWLGYVIQLERKNSELNDLVVKLFGKFQSMGLAPVLMKGQAFATNYPVPLHRQSGDIDVCFRCHDDCERAVAWAVKVDRAAAVSADNRRERKHFTFSVGGNVVELHYFMCLFENGRLQRRLQEIIDWEFGHSEPLFVEIDGKRIETIPPTLSVLHQILHITRHLLEAGIGLRQICDLAVYLDRNHETVDAERLNGYLEELQLMDTAKALGYVMVEHLGLHPDFVPFGTDGKYAGFILQEVFEGGNFGRKKVAYRNGENGVRRKLLSIVYFYHRCRLYRHLLPMESKSYFLNKIKLNIRLLTVRK